MPGDVPATAKGSEANGVSGGLDEQMAGLGAYGNAQDAIGRPVVEAELGGRFVEFARGDVGRTKRDALAMGEGRVSSGGWSAGRSPERRFAAGRASQLEQTAGVEDGTKVGVVTVI